MMLQIAIILLFFTTTINGSTPLSPSYIGAVVEYHPVSKGNDGRAVAMQNAANVRKIVKKASEFNVDVIVFPEIGITASPVERSWTFEEKRKHYAYAASYVPSPDEKVVLCDADERYAESLKSISCTARDYRMYVVVNHHEKYDCSGLNCQSDNLFLYNTNAVFDREGRLIARSRKYNLYDEAGIDNTTEPEVSIFKTDFGVIFGQLICADLFYAVPSLDLVKKHKITDIIFSTMWFNKLPFTFSLEMQAAWAYLHNVNFLASNYNDLSRANAGSGIYFGRDKIAQITDPTIAGTQLMIAEVPKIIDGKRHHLNKLTKPKVYRFSQEEMHVVWDNKKIFLKDNLMFYNTAIVDSRSCLYKKKLCQNGLCCDFELEIDFNENLVDGTEYYKYRIGIINGAEYTSDDLIVGLEVCALFACRNETLESCGEQFTEDVKVAHPTNFRSISIKRENDEDPQKFFLPVTLTTNLIPVDISKISFNKIKISEDGESENLEISLKKDERNIITFAIYGRNVARDVNKNMLKNK